MWFTPGTRNCHTRENPTKLSAAIDIAVTHDINRGLRDIAKLTSSQTTSNIANVKITTSGKVENTPQIMNDKNIMYCEFCKKPGHKLLDCRPLRRKIMNEKSDTNPYSSNT